MNQSNTQESSGEKPSRGRGRGLRIITVVFMVAGLSWFGYWYLHGKNFESTENAQVAGNLIYVMPRIAGTVIGIHAENSDFVEKGQMLIELDNTDAVLAVQKAQAELAQSVRDSANLFAREKSARVTIRLRQTEFANAKNDLHRRESVIEGAVSSEDLQHARDAVAIATANLTLAQRRLAEVQAQTGNTTIAEHPRVVSAAARLREALIDQGRCKILAPQAGHVAKRTVQVGQQVTQSSRLLAILPLDQLWAEVNFKESQLAGLRIGQPVSMVSDVYRDTVEYHGKILGLEPGTGASFSLLPPQNATGNWIKILQRVPVRVSLDQKALKSHPLFLGVSLTATVDMSNTSGSILAEALVTEPRFSTDVYASSLSEIDRQIEIIIQNNLPPENIAHE